MQIFFFFDFVKLRGYIAFVAYVVSSNPGIGPSSRIKIFLFLSSNCTEESIWISKIMSLFPYFNLQIKILNENQILCHNRYICIDLGQNS